MSTINPLPPNLIHLFNNTPVSTIAERLAGEEGSFADILTEAMNTVGVTDSIDKGSMMQLMMGQSDDLSGLLIDAQKAELSLQLALQIRNKVIDAYNEVMRMSV